MKISSPDLNVWHSQAQLPQPPAPRQHDPHRQRCFPRRIPYPREIPPRLRPFVCGPYNVPFLNLPRSGHRVRGELYAVSLSALAPIDILEGIATGHYERLPITVARPTDGNSEKEMVCVQAYYAHRSYAEEMWRWSGEEGMAEYTQEATHGYVRRADWPQNKTFLEHIQIFLSSRWQRRSRQWV